MAEADWESAIWYSFRYAIACKCSYLYSGILEAFAVYGACDLSAPIQSTELFKDYTFAVSRGEYILINYVQLFIIVYMLSLVLWVFLNSCNASSLGIIALCMLMGVEVLLYVNIEPKSRWELLRK